MQHIADAVSYIDCKNISYVFSASVLNNEKLIKWCYDTD